MRGRTSKHNHTHMKNLQEKFSLTELESNMLNEVVSRYEFTDNICFRQKLSSQEKGIIGSLVKKGLIYDSIIDADGHDEGNFFPSDDVLDFFELEHY